MIKPKQKHFSLEEKLAILMKLGDLQRAGKLKVWGEASGQHGVTIGAANADWDSRYNVPWSHAEQIAELGDLDAVPKKPARREPRRATLVRRASKLVAVLILAILPASGGVNCRGSDELARRLPLAIARVEGWLIAGSLARRLHNPGLLIFAGQIGARRGEQGYALFRDDESGLTALAADIDRKICSGGMTLRSISRIWSTKPEEWYRQVAFALQDVK